jgi:heme oxygenase
MTRSARVSLPALATDLRFLHGARWAQRIAASPSTTVYWIHLRDTAVRQMSGFVAHHYARHIEDLSAEPIWVQQRPSHTASTTQGASS